MPDSYRTLQGSTVAEPERIRGSRFIGEAFPVRSEAEVEARIAEVRTREPKATHHCWAFRLRPDHERSSDDGEPSGTAGAPILRQIQARDLTDTLVVVTRYYGGTKLGTGGLVRAYGDAAAAALEAARIVERAITQNVRLRFAYDDTAAAMSVLHRFNAGIVDQEYGEDTSLIVSVRRSLGDELVDAFTEALGGRGEATVLAVEEAGAAADEPTREHDPPSPRTAS